MTEAKSKCTSCTGSLGGCWFENSDGRFCKSCFRRLYPKDFERFSAGTEKSFNESAMVQGILEEMRFSGISTGDVMFVSALKDIISRRVGYSGSVIGTYFRVLHANGYIQAEEAGWKILRVE